MDPNTHIYFVNKLIIFYVLQFTVSKYKRRLHLRGWETEAQPLPASPSVTAGRAAVNPGARTANKIPAIKPEGPQGSPWAGLWKPPLFFQRNPRLSYHMSSFAWWIFMNHPYPRTIWQFHEPFSGDLHSVQKRTLLLPHAREEMGPESLDDPEKQVTPRKGTRTQRWLSGFHSWTSPSTRHELEISLVDAPGMDGPVLVFHLMLFAVLQMGPSTLHMLGECSTT